MIRRGPTERTMAWNWILLAVLFTASLTQGAVEVSLEPYYTPWFVKEGSNFTVKCVVRNAERDLAVEAKTIVYDDISVKGFTVRKNVIMEFNKPVINAYINKNPIVKTDNGGYICMAGDKEKIFNIVVSEVTTQSSNVTVGEDVTIKCDPNTNFNNMKVIWSKGGQRVDTIPSVKDRVKLGENNFSLTIQKAVEDDAGEYECDVIFFEGTPSSHSFKDMAKMFGKPYFRNEKADSTVSLSGNQSIDLTCNAHGYPKPDVAWLKDDDVIQQEGRVTITDTGSGSRLQIADVLQTDAGIYVCNVENSLGRKQRSFVVSIEGVINSASYLRIGFAQLVLVLCFLLFAQ